MAQWAVQDKAVSIRVACMAFGISPTCYGYQTKRSSENSEIADWLIRLTTRNVTGDLDCAFFTYGM